MVIILILKRLAALLVVATRFLNSVHVDVIESLFLSHHSVGRLGLHDVKSLFVYHFIHLLELSFLLSLELLLLHALPLYMLIYTLLI